MCVSVSVSVCKSAACFMCIFIFFSFLLLIQIHNDVFKKIFSAIYFLYI